MDIREPHFQFYWSSSVEGEWMKNVNVLIFGFNLLSSPVRVTGLSEIKLNLVDYE